MEWILNRSTDFDAVVLPGDLLDSVSPTPLLTQIFDVSAYLSDLSQLTIVMAASGNHDLDGPGPDGEQRASWLSALRGPALYGDGQSMDVDGVRFTVCPWWDGPQTKEIVERQLELPPSTVRPAGSGSITHFLPALASARQPGATTAIATSRNGSIVGGPRWSSVATSTRRHGSRVAVGLIGADRLGFSMPGTRLVTNLPTS